MTAIVLSTAAVVSLLSFADIASAEGLSVLLSVSLLAIILIGRGFDAYSQDVSPIEYFGASSELSSATTLQSLSSAWIMLANVVVADMFLGQTLGAWTAWMLGTWALAFLLMSRRVEKVRSVLTAEDTLHSFLHDAYGSKLMRKMAGSVTAIVALGVFSLELLVGMALLTAVIPGNAGEIAAPLLIVLILLAMCIAVISGGLRAVIVTDSLLLPVVFLGILSLGIFSAFAASIYIPHRAPINWVPDSLTAWDASAFIVGVTALQLPLLLADYGTWQRIKATKADTPEERDQLRSHMRKQALRQAFLWGVPVLAGMSLIGLPSLYDGNLEGSSDPLIEITRNWLAHPGIAEWIRVALVTIFLIGMLAVMISTANTYLIVGMETWVRDLRPISDEGVLEGDGRVRGVVSRARTACLFIALLACTPIVIFLETGIYLLGVIVIIFSLQVALVPAVVLGLYRGDIARQLRVSVVCCTISGFAAAFVFGIYASYFGSDWARSYGIFLTSGIALLVPSFGIYIRLIRKGFGWRVADGMLTKMLNPFV